jgi:hypothetical protein
VEQACRNGSVGKSTDGEGVEFSFIDFCGYVAMYVSVKEACELSFENNDGALQAKSYRTFELS